MGATASGRSAGHRSIAAPLGGQVLVLFQAQPPQLVPCRQPVRELLVDPAHEVLARRDRPAFPELRQGGVEVLVVQALDDVLLDQRVEPAEVDNEAGLRIDLAADGDVQAVVVAVARQVRALAEAGAVRRFVPLRTAVQVAGAETVAALQGDLHLISFLRAIPAQPPYNAPREEPAEPLYRDRNPRAPGAGFPSLYLHPAHPFSLRLGGDDHPPRAAGVDRRQAAPADAAEHRRPDAADVPAVRHPDRRRAAVV